MCRALISLLWFLQSLSSTLFEEKKKLEDLTWEILSLEDETFLLLNRYLNLRVKESLDSRILDRRIFSSTHAPTLSVWLHMWMNSNIIIRNVCVASMKKKLNILAHCVHLLSNRDNLSSKSKNKWHWIKISLINLFSLTRRTIVTNNYYYYLCST